MVILHPCGYIGETIPDPRRDSGVVRREIPAWCGIVTFEVTTFESENKIGRSLTVQQLLSFIHNCIVDIFDLSMKPHSLIPYYYIRNYHISYSLMTATHFGALRLHPSENSSNK